MLHLRVTVWAGTRPAPGAAETLGSVVGDRHAGPPGALCNGRCEAARPGLLPARVAGIFLTLCQPVLLSKAARLACMSSRDFSAADAGGERDHPGCLLIPPWPGWTALLEPVPCFSAARVVRG